MAVSDFDAFNDFDDDDFFELNDVAEIQLLQIEHQASATAAEPAIATIKRLQQELQSKNGELAIIRNNNEKLVQDMIQLKSFSSNEVNVLKHDFKVQLDQYQTELKFNRNNQKNFEQSLNHKRDNALLASPTQNNPRLLNRHTFGASSHSLGARISNTADQIVSLNVIDDVSTHISPADDHEISENTPRAVQIAQSNESTQTIAEFKSSTIDSNDGANQSHSISRKDTEDELALFISTIKQALYSNVFTLPNHMLEELLSFLDDSAYSQSSFVAYIFTESKLSIQSGNILLLSTLIDFLQVMIETSSKCRDAFFVQDLEILALITTSTKYEMFAVSCKVYEILKIVTWNIDSIQRKQTLQRFLAPCNLALLCESSSSSCDALLANYLNWTGLMLWASDIASFPELIKHDESKSILIYLLMALHRSESSALEFSITRFMLVLSSMAIDWVYETIQANHHAIIFPLVKFLYSLIPDLKDVSSVNIESVKNLLLFISNLSLHDPLVFSLNRSTGVMVEDVEVSNGWYYLLVNCLARVESDQSEELGDCCTIAGDVLRNI